MAQHDMNIANQGFPATRADLNNALQALASNNSGTSAPSTTFANQWWYDTTNNKLYIRNEANNAWIQVAVLDQTNNEWQITTGVIQAKDGDGLALKTDDGTTRLFIKDSDGSIGIGTSSPASILHVKGRTLAVDGAAASDSPRLNLDLDGTNKASVLLNRSTEDLQLTVVGNNMISFTANSSEKVRIDNDGMKFNGDTGADNALNDYERGLHAFGITAGGISRNTLYQNWQYIKIGDFVNVHGLCLVTATGDSNALKLSLPFTAKTGLAQTADATHGMTSSYNVPTGTGGIRCTVSKNTSDLRFLKTVDNGVWTNLLGNELADGDHLYINITYEAA